MMTNAGMKEFREQFFALIDHSERIVITSHMSPDDDSIGSVLTMYAVLTEKYPQKNIKIIYTGNPVSRYAQFYNFEKIEWVDDVGNHVEMIDTLILLDSSQYVRFSRNPEKLQAVPHTIIIDHHASVADTSTVMLYQPDFSSNCELIYRAIIEGTGYSKEVAEYLLLGITGDTGSFRYVQPTQTDVFILAKELIEKVGTTVEAFRSRFSGIPISVIPLMQELVKNTSYVTVDGWPPAQYTYIDREVLLAGNYTDEDMSAASHIYIGQYLPKVEGYGWGFIVTPRTDGACRMSGRSLPGNVNVRNLHERMGIGGGHDRASGGFFAEPDPKDCITKVLDWMKANMPLLG